MIKLMETKDSVGNVLNDGDTIIVAKTIKSERDVENPKKRR